MRLTAHTDYSLRVLMYLNREKNRVTIDQLSKKLRISRNNLIKVSHRLGKLGFIDTARGRAGGLTIQESAGRATLREIVSRTEERFNIAECFSGKEISCVFLGGCLLKKSLADALESFLKTLGKTTLNDVTPGAGSPPGDDRKRAPARKTAGRSRRRTQFLSETGIRQQDQYTNGISFGVRRA